MICVKPGLYEERVGPSLQVAKFYHRLNKVGIDEATKRRQSGLDCFALGWDPVDPVRAQLHWVRGAAVAASFRLRCRDVAIFTRTPLKDATDSQLPPRRGARVKLCGSAWGRIRVPLLQGPTIVGIAAYYYTAKVGERASCQQRLIRVMHIH
jgi:hypothetical protein